MEDHTWALPSAEGDLHACKCLHLPLNSRHHEVVVRVQLIQHGVEVVHARPKSLHLVHICGGGSLLRVEEHRQLDAEITHRVRDTMRR